MTARTSAFLVPHVALLRGSYRRWTGRELVPAAVPPREAVALLDRAPFALVSHAAQADPIFNYANETALHLFEMDWAAFTSLPSRLSAEAAERPERTRLLERVSEQGYADDYRGVRVAATGRRFLIRDATVWNVTDEDGRHRGQAALIRAWQPL